MKNGADSNQTVPLGFIRVKSDKDLHSLHMHHAAPFCLIMVYSVYSGNILLFMTDHGLYSLVYSGMVLLLYL